MNKSDLLCINIETHYDIPLSEKLKTVKAAGFDAVFYDKERYCGAKKSEAFAAECEKNGLIFHSIHAPFYGMDDIWHDESGELSKIIEADLYDSIDECYALGVPLVIMHAIIGMDRCTPTDLGIKRLEKIIDYAVSKNITIGFENTEGEVYLKRIFDTFGIVPNVGFCFDSGHEMCYNYSRDLLKEYGNLLVSTHLNDNLGMTYLYNMTFLDDSHLLPFDGIRDWEKTALSLRRCGYSGMLTFELNPKSKPGRHANDIYSCLDYEQYIGKAFERADRFRELYKKTK